MVSRSLRVVVSTGLLVLVCAGLILAWALTRPPSVNAPCGRGTPAADLQAVMQPARRIAAQEDSGGSERRALHTVLSDQTLAQAVSDHDTATIRSQLLELLYNHQHIVRLRVTRGGRLVMDIGGRFVLQPVAGALRVRGRTVGRVEISIQDDMGYMLLAKRLVGADAVERFGDQTEMSDIAAGDRPLPSDGTIVLGGRRYLVESFDATRFPSGRLRISILVGTPPRALYRQTCAGIRADVYADVARRVYDASLTGPSPTIAVQALAGSAALHQALESGSRSAIHSAVQGLAGADQIIALRVFGPGGRLLAQAGSTAGTIAPVSGELVGPGNTRLGSYELTVQTGAGSIGISGSLLKAPVLMRVGGRPLPGTPAGPRDLPARGVVSYNGRSYAVRSFVVGAFPSRALRIYALAPQ